MQAIARIFASDEERRDLRIAMERDGMRSLGAWILAAALLVARSGLSLRDIEARLVGER